MPLVFILGSSKSRWTWGGRWRCEGAREEQEAPWWRGPSICPEESTTPCTSAPITQSDRWLTHTSYTHHTHTHTHTHTHVNATSLGSDDIRDEVRVQQNRRWCWSFNKKCDRVQSVLCVFLTCWLISIHWESQYVTATGMTVSDWPAGVC